MIADDVRGGIIPAVGHLIPGEAPDFLTAQLDAFFDPVESPGE